MTKINSKKKGNKFENFVANYFRDNGIKMWRDSASGTGTREKADCGNDINLHLECKSVKKINLKEVWHKAKFECEKTHNEPCLAIRFDGMPEEEFLITISNDYFLELLTGGKKVDADYKKPEMTWAFQNCREALRKALKFLEVI